MRDAIIKLLENKDFVEKIIAMEDAQEVKKSFKENGVEISDSELDELGAIISEIVEILNKMPEDELNSVSGGAELRSSNIWGADLIRKAVGYKPTQFNDEIIKSRVDVGTVSWGKEIEGVQLKSKGKYTNSDFKNFIGRNANEIALGTIVAVGTTALCGGAYGSKYLVRWYKKNYCKR